MMSNTPPLPVILIVDDEPLILRMMCRILKRHATVVPCSSGQDALHAIHSVQSITFILSDLIMPNMTGLELYRIIQEKHPKHADHFVLFSGGAPSLRRLSDSDSTWPLLLPKPIKLGTLLKLIKRYSANAPIGADVPTNTSKVQRPPFF